MSALASPTDVAADPARHRAWPGALAIAALGALAFANSFDGRFLFDDAYNIVANPNLRSLWPLWEACSAPPESGLAGRPVASLSYAVNYALGGLEPAGYHAVNLAIHLAAALALFGVLARGLALAGVEAGAGRGVALATAVLWTVHPIQTASVTYIGQRIEALMGLFFLLAVYASFVAWTFARPGRWFLLAAVCAWLAAATKEVAVALPPFVLLADVVLSRRSAARVLRARPFAYAGLFSCWVPIGLSVLSSSGRAASVGFHFEGLGVLDYLRLQAGALTGYLRLVVDPSGLSLDHGRTPVPAAAVWASQGALVLALLGASAWLLARRRPLGLTGAWFFLILAPTSSLLPIVTEVRADHRMYLPLAAPLLLLVLAGRALLGSVRSDALRRGLAAASVLALAAAAIAATRARNELYADTVAIWEDAVAKSPGNARAHGILGNVLSAEGRADEALEHWLEAHRLDPDEPGWAINAGALAVAYGRRDEGLAMLEEVVRAHPTLEVAQRAMADTADRLGDDARAARAERALLALQPQALDVRRRLADRLARMGQWSDAAQELRTIAGQRSGDGAALESLAWILAAAPDATVRDGSKATALATAIVEHRRTPERLALLAAARAEAGAFAEAAALAREAAGASSGARAAELERHAARYERGEPLRLDAWERRPGAGP